MTNYNGWTNYETWNVALWIDNEEGWKILAEESGDYKSFIERMREGDSLETPDRVAWNDSGINVREINEKVFQELCM
tara:strand:+ start:3520 stop:3750 length:231 start_codon:yes stop_codon:yes gene_type:complete